MINKRVDKGKIVVMIIDMKAAFDSVDRGIIVESMRKRGVMEELMVKCEEMLRESRVRVGKRKGEFLDG